MKRSLVVLAVGGLAVTGLSVAAGADEEFVVDTRADTVDVAPGDGECEDASGDCSLRAAVQEANALAGQQRIRLAGGGYVLTRTGAGEDAAATGDLDLTDRTVVVGNGSSVDARGIDRVFDVRSSGRLSAVDLVVRGGAVARNQDGANIRNGGLLQLREVAVTGGQGGRFGGGISSTGTLRLERVLVQGNTSQTAGGGIANGGDAQLREVRLRDNTSVVGGGLANRGSVDAQTLQVLDNTARLSGGGISNEAGGSFTARDVFASGNVAEGGRADTGGGALANRGGTVSLRDARLDDNTATNGSGSGGAVLTTAGEVRLLRVSADGNEAARAGGAVEVVDGRLLVNQSALTGNATGPRPGNGGAVHVSGAARTAFNDVVVSGNTATTEGGGLWNSGTGAMSVINSEISDNVANGPAADNGGGGLFNNGGRLLVRNTVVSDNDAPGTSGSGGGLLNDGGDVRVQDSEVSENTAVRAGGGIETTAGGRIQITNTLLADNAVGSNPGNGGGLHQGGDGTTRIDGIEITGNTAVEGGGLWNSSDGDMVVTDGTCSDNTPSDLYQDPPKNGTFTFNGGPGARGPVGLPGGRQLGGRGERALSALR